MGKDKILVNIYMKIHEKKPLTMDDLRYLAEYAPECFEKTCKNVVHSMPEAKPIMEPAKNTSLTASKQAATTQDAISHSYNIDDILTNLRLLESNQFPVAELDLNNVKNLLGNTYMELLFEHSDKETFANLIDKGNTSLFDAKI